MAAPARTPARYRPYACEACGAVHERWSPRCHQCQGLRLVPLVQVITPIPLDDVPPEAAPATAPIEAAQESPQAAIDAAVEQVARADTAPPRPRSGRGRPAPVLELAANDPSDPIPLDEVEDVELERYQTGIEPLDAVLGGGMVVGSVIVLSAEPGAGKSTLTMQAMAGVGVRVLYATGEETVTQAASSARRINAASHTVLIAAETELETVLAQAHKVRARVIAIDSIQTMQCADVSASPGSPTQVRECAARLMKFAKATGITIWMIGHVTGDGALAGPKTLKHLVDVVLELENGRGARRTLRCGGKNRFGSSLVVGKFSITSHGLVPVVDDSEPDAAEPEIPDDQLS